MKKVLLNVFLITVFTLSLSMFTNLEVSEAQSTDTDKEIRELKMEINKLLQRVEKLEQQKAEEKAKKEEIETNIKSYVDRRIQRFSVFPTSKLSISGFGTFGFTNSDNDSSTFTASVNPIFHYKLTDKIHFIFETEFELEDNETDVDLEIGEVDIFLNDYLTLVAGKFLLPFNVFSERLHPTWINKLPSFPLIYRSGEGSPRLIPVLSNVGAQLRGGAPLPLYKGSKINYAFYVVNGPRANIVGPEDNQEVDVDFNKNFEDNNSNKAVGGRIGVLPVWNVELGASLMYADAGRNTDVFMFGFDGEYHYRQLELRGEYIYQQHDKLNGGNEENNGFYLQAAYRLSGITLANQEIQQYINRLEPVVRYGSIYREAQDDVHGLTLGTDYWVLPSVPIKIAYEINDSVPSRFLIQLAVGF